ncbi:hypothetical protein SLS53_008648 [Cytospora paraplurivora]|uniref:Uncharacterized protein n=1 Tax=Cytospora paraplurivora TaxID=2898453 RepID=A0AAN9TXU5_9PEZI
MQGGIVVDLTWFTMFKVYRSYTSLAVGEGIGRYHGSLGLVTDRVLTVRVVTRREILSKLGRAPGDNNADLFWGLRGAGANFGIVWSATYQAARKSDHSNGKVLTVDLIYSADKTLAYFEHLEILGDELLGKVAGMHIIHYITTEDDAEMFANLVWFSPEEEGREFLAHFIEIYWVSLFQDAFDTLDDFYIEWPDGRGTASVLEIFQNQAVINKDRDFDAYMWRDATIVLDASDQLGAMLRASWT